MRTTMGHASRVAAAILAGVAVAGCIAGPALADGYVPPTVRVDDDGDYIQLAPDDTAEDAVYYQQVHYTSYNTYYLNADERGCKACHDDLKKLLHESYYDHTAADENDRIEWTVKTCQGCHSVWNNGSFTEDGVLGNLIHSIHMDVDMSCWNCHATNPSSITMEIGEDDGKMVLWEDARTQQMRGFTDVAADNLDASSFSYTQDYVESQDEKFLWSLHYFDNDYMRAENTFNNVPLDEEMLENWSITVSGEVGQEKTFNLKELIDDPEVPKVTTPMKWSCMLNPIGGSLISQVEVTGIPLDYLVEQCGGLTEDAAVLFPVGSDGFSDGAGVDLSIIEGKNNLLVYEMNGEPLSWENGYPVVLALGGNACSAYVREVSDLVYQDASNPVFEPNGWPADNSGEVLYNKPNIGIYDLKDCQVVQAGETMTISGYADSYDWPIAGIELSFDRGQTWVYFETPDTDIEKMIVWEYEFTPEEEGTYYLMARSVAENGEKTVYPVEKMFTAVADMESLG